MKVSLIVFTLNEIEGVKVIMPKIKKEWCDQILFVDGGSTDGTIEYLKENKYDYFIQREKGMSAAFKEAVPKTTGDIVIMFAPDGNSITETIPELSDKIINQGYDISIGSRYFNGIKSDDDDMVTRFGNWMFTSLFNFFFKTNFADVLNMYRAYKRDWLIQHVNDTDSLSWGTSLLATAVRENLMIIEVASYEPARIGGSRKMSPLVNGFSELCMVLKEGIKKWIC